MRISRIDLKAFGHFTDKVVEFQDSPDFHFVFGPNEAGKTTISRAISEALFGIHTRSKDAFLHPYNSLRVGVVLDSAGTQLAAMRRKGNRNTLFRYDVDTGEELEPIDEEILSNLTGGLSRSLFTSMFGLDHEQLIEGGIALSEGQGEVGQALFEAGAGLSTVRQFRESLQKEADDLYRPRASSTKVMKVLGEYSTHKSSARDAATRHSTWDGLRKEMMGAKKRHEDAKRSRDALQGNVRRLERLVAVLPDVAKRERAVSRMAEMAQVTELASGAAQERSKIELLQDSATSDLTKARAELQKVTDATNSLRIDNAVLAEASAIEALFHQKAQYREAVDQSVVSASRQADSSARTADLAREIGIAPDVEFGGFLPSATLKADVQRLVAGMRACVAEQLHAEETVELADEELRRIDGELEALGHGEVPEILRETIRAIEELGNPEARVQELSERTLASARSIEAAANDLIEGGVSTLKAAKPVLPEEVSSYENEKSALADALKSLESRLDKNASDTNEVLAELAGLASQGDLPTIEQLEGQREARDAIWQRVRRMAFAEEGPPFELVLSPEVYESAVKDADSTADARFFNAALVSEHANLVARRERLNLERETAVLAVAEKRRAIDGMEQEWRSLLSSKRVPCMGAKALGEWLARREAVIERHERWLSEDAELKDQAAKAELWRTRLSTALLAGGVAACSDTETLAQALARGREFVQRADGKSAQANALGKQRPQAELKLQRAGTKRETLRTRRAALEEEWQAAMGELLLEPCSVPEVAEARLDQFAQLGEEIRRLNDAEANLQKTRATESRFRQEVERVCAVLGEACLDRNPDSIVELLFARLKRACEVRDESKALSDRAGRIVDQIEESEAALQESNEKLHALMQAAGCKTREELIEAESLSEEWRNLKAMRDEVEARLVESSAMPLDSLFELVAGQDLVEVRAQADGATAELQEVTQEVEKLHGEYIAAAAAFEAIDGTSRASIEEQSAASAAASLAQHIDDYVAASLASAVLAEVIETYQAKHQGPLLERASEVFARISGGRYSGIATDWNEDKMVLVAVSATGARKRIDALSSGRRDQLFLALRIAAIDSYVTNREPIPVIIDDLVINFDDEAATATFGVLRDLAKKTQVIFFTHHEHLLECVERSMGDSFVSHKLVA